MDGFVALARGYHLAVDIAGFDAKTTGYVDVKTSVSVVNT
jgi:hypothetical protein